MTEVLEFPNAPPPLALMEPPVLEPPPPSLVLETNEVKQQEVSMDVDTVDATKCDNPGESANDEQAANLLQLQPNVDGSVGQEEEKPSAEASDDVPTSFEGKLERNSAIPVTIDDLNEGMIVVSLQHNNKTYQGVLLQLSRERGIPCGISFPKEFCPGIGTTSASDVDPNDPNQVSPINQRNTYFQQNDAGGPKSRLALRRVIKPPARYKNARNHLKLRTRPILCIKCKALCEDQNAAAAANNDNEGNDKKSGAAPIVGGVTTRRGYAKFISSGNFNGTENSNDATEGGAPKEEDFSFKSIGSKGVVDNYWKRPLNEAKEEPTTSNAHNLTNLTVNLPKINLSKAMKTMPELKPMVPMVATCGPSNPILLKSLTAPFKHNEQNPATGNCSDNQLSKSKVKSLGDCIDTLTARKIKDFEKNPVNKRKLHKSRVVRNVAQSSASDTESTGSSGSTTRNMGANKRASKQELEDVDAHGPTRRKSGGSKGEDRSGGKKRSSTIPERYRDETYLTKNSVFGFKKRRIDDAETTASSGNEVVAVQFNDELPMSLVGCLEKRHPITYNPAPSSAKIAVPTSTTKTSPPVKEGTKKQTELKVSVKERSSSTSSISPNSSCIASTSKNSGINASTSTNTGAGCSSSHGGGRAAAEHAEQQQEVHSNKTPVIKITFGTSGNGMVVQIPPKETQNPSAISAPSIIPNRSEASVGTSSKAARKAMKKAKKAAKKNRSMSFESALASSSSRSSSTKATSTKSFDNHPSTPAYIVTSTSLPTSSSRLLHSPSPPILNPEYPFQSPGYSSSDNSNANGEHPPHHLLPRKVEFPTPAVYVPKKKKKDKRKKKSKTSGKQIAKASSSSNSLPKFEPSDNCTSSSSGSHQSIMSLCEDAKLRRLYHPEEGPLTTDDDTDVDSAPVLRNELLESLKYESENSTTSAASTETDHQERLCISLKRLSSSSNAYVTCSKSTMSEPSSSSSSRTSSGTSTTAAADSSDNAVAGPSGVRTSSQSYRFSIEQLQQSMNSSASNDPADHTSSDASTSEMNNNNYSTASEASDNEFPMNMVGSPAYDENFGGSANSIDSHSVDNPPYTFRKGDIVWAKLKGAPWWPAKIMDIIYLTEDDIRAKVYWYNASTQSFIGFSNILQFAKHFEEKFNRARRRTTYRKAVRQALIEAHRNNPEDLPSD